MLRLDLIRGLMFQPIRGWIWRSMSTFCHSILSYRFIRTTPQKICVALKVLSVGKRSLPPPASAQGIIPKVGLAPTRLRKERSSMYRDEEEDKTIYKVVLN